MSDKYKVSKRSVLKMKGKEGGKNTEKFKSKSYVSKSDDSKISKLKYRSNKKGRATERWKQIKKNADGTYILQKCNAKGKCRTKKVSKIRGKSITKKMKRGIKRLNNKK